jgi:hypothetical protein
MIMMLAQMILANLHVVVSTHISLVMTMINVLMITAAHQTDANTILLLATITTPAQKMVVIQALDVPMKRLIVTIMMPVPKMDVVKYLDVLIML